MLLVILLNKEQQTPSNILLCSVSVGDICYIIFDAVFQVSIHPVKRNFYFWLTLLSNCIITACSFYLERCVKQKRQLIYDVGHCTTIYILCDSFIYMHFILQMLLEYYRDVITINDHVCKSAVHISTALYCLTVLHNTTIAVER